MSTKKRNPRIPARSKLWEKLGLASKDSTRMPIELQSRNGNTTGFTTFPIGFR